MNDIEKAIETQQGWITSWENRIQDLEEVIKEYPWGRDGLEYDFDDWRATELRRRKEQVRIALITISALEKQLNGGWIPISERLPESDGFYICTVKELDITVSLIFTAYDSSWMDEYESEYETIAWCPLPEPYKDGGRK